MIDEKDLGNAVKNDQDTIEIEGDLAKKVIKIKATGKVAWGACALGLTIAISATIATVATAGTSAPVTVPAGLIGMGTATTTLGATVATSAVAIGVAGGGIGALNKLRKYKLEKINDQKIILHKKK